MTFWILYCRATQGAKLIPAEGNQNAAGGLHSFCLPQLAKLPAAHRNLLGGEFIVLSRTKPGHNRCKLNTHRLHTKGFIVINTQQHEVSPS